MTEMKTIVFESFPVERLPAEIRARIEGSGMVRLTVESKDPVPETMALRSFLGAATGLFSSPQEAVEFIRMLRDESDR